MSVRAGVQLEGIFKASLEVCLFRVAEDAPCEAGEVVVSLEEAGYAREVDDVGADVEGKGEGEWFHWWRSCYFKLEGFDWCNMSDR